VVVIEEISLRDFLIEQSRSLQMLIEVQDPLTLAQASMASAQDLLPLQSADASADRCSGVVAPILLVV
jgi:hypothetical protein